MMSEMSRRKRSAAFLAAALLLLGPGSAFAQDVSLPALKAAFVANFAKFATWPDDPLQGRAATFCVIGDRAVAEALDHTLKGAPSSKNALVLVLPPDGPLRSCDLLYVSGLDVKGTLQVLDAVKGAAVFTVSDSDKFAERGGIAQLVLEKGRMRFAINTAAAQRARIVLSAKLLNLATLVKDVNDEGR